MLLGVLQLQLNATTVVAPAGIVSGEAFGVAALARVVAPAGVASSEAIGVPALARTVVPVGIASAQVVGTPAIAEVIAPVGIASAAAFGAPAVARTVSPVGVSSAAAFGLAALARTITPIGIATGNALGAPSLTLTVAPAGIATVGAFGTPTLGRTVAPSGIASAAAFGAPALNQNVKPASAASGEAFGAPTVSAGSGTQTIAPIGIASQAAIGTPTVVIFSVLVPQRAFFAGGGMPSAPWAAHAIPEAESELEDEHVTWSKAWEESLSGYIEVEAPRRAPSAPPVQKIRYRVRRRSRPHRILQHVGAALGGNPLGLGDDALGHLGTGVGGYAATRVVAHVADRAWPRPHTEAIAGGAAFATLWALTGVKSLKKWKTAVRVGAGVALAEILFRRYLAEDEYHEVNLHGVEGEGAPETGLYALE